MKLSNALTVIVVVLVLAYIAHDAMRPGPVLPPAVAARIDRYETTKVVDSAAIVRLEREKKAARDRELAAAGARRVSDSLAALAGRRADSLAAVAASARTAADSAIAWQAAYDSRTREARQLERSRDSARAEARELEAQRDSTGRQSDIWKRRALEGDSIIRDLRPLAAQASRRWRAAVMIGAGCSDKGCGPQVTAGASYEIRLPKISLPFGR